MEKIKILVATHKKVKIKSFGKCYLLIQVGSKNAKNRFPYLHDDEGDNISEKNPTYCELTALYWAEKNIKAEYKGLCHYRRYLAKHYFSMNSYKNVFTEKELSALCDKYDVLLPEKKYRGIENAWYADEKELLNDRSYKFIYKAISEICPNYLKTLKKVFLDKKMFFCNVMIARSDIFDEYCKWLFELEFHIENILNENGGVWPRELGFYSEFLLNVWIEKNKDRFKIGYFPLARVDRKKDLKQFWLTVLERTKVLYLAEKIKYEIIYMKKNRN